MIHILLGISPASIGVAPFQLLLNHAGIPVPEKIIVAGFFGSFLAREDMRTLGMIPKVPPSAIHIVGNAAGAVMALCSDPIFG